MKNFAKPAGAHLRGSLLFQSIGADAENTRKPRVWPASLAELHRVPFAVKRHCTDFNVDIQTLSVLRSNNHHDAYGNVGIRYRRKCEPKLCLYKTKQMATLIETKQDFNTLDSREATTIVAQTHLSVFFCLNVLLKNGENTCGKIVSFVFN